MQATEDKCAFVLWVFDCWLWRSSVFMLRGGEIDPVGPCCGEMWGIIGVRSHTWLDQRQLLLLLQRVFIVFCVSLNHAHKHYNSCQNCQACYFCSVPAEQPNASNYQMRVRQAVIQCISGGDRVGVLTRMPRACTFFNICKKFTVAYSHVVTRSWTWTGSASFHAVYWSIFAMGHIDSSHKK